MFWLNMSFRVPVVDKKPPVLWWTASKHITAGFGYQIKQLHITQMSFDDKALNKKHQSKESSYKHHGISLSVVFLASVITVSRPN